MTRTTSTASLLLLAIVAAPAVAETTPASSPVAAPTTAPAAVPTVAESPTTSSSPDTAAAVADPAAAVDAFGLPCEVTFTPRSTAAAARSKPAKKGRATRATRAAQRQPDTTMATGGLGRGGDFALGRTDRGPAAPKGDAEVRMHAATVTPAMVGLVVREHAAELELCLSKLPRAARAATVGLVLTIEPDGTASAARVTGAPQAPDFAACLATQARTWAYPHADAAVQIEYPITVNGR